MHNVSAMPCDGTTSLRSLSAKATTESLVATSTLRVLAVSEASTIAAHFAELGDAGRFARFGHVPSREALATYALGFATGGRIGLGVSIGSRLIGLADLARGPETDNDIELAVSVVLGHQGRGIGRQLVRSALELVAHRQLGRLCLYCARDNERARRLGLHLSRNPLDLGSLLLFRADGSTNSAQRTAGAGAASNARYISPAPLPHNGRRNRASLFS